MRLHTTTQEDSPYDYMRSCIQAPRHAGTGRGLSGIDAKETMMPPSARLHVRLASTQKRQLAALAVQRQTTLTQLVERALVALLEPDPPTADALAALRPQLERLHRQVLAQQEQLDVLTETLALFVRLYLSTTPEVPETQKAAAGRSGLARYQRFVQALAERLDREQRLRTDLLQAWASATPGAPPQGGSDDAAD